MLMQLIHHIESFSMYGENSEYYLRGIYWTIRCCIPRRSTILYVLNSRNLHFTYTKQPKIHGIWK
nr:probable alpha-mannosidase I MNS5 isoform X2 [Ipomoea batatas]